jgi:hypothetical protein
MDNVSELQELALQEPWRLGIGVPDSSFICSGSKNVQSDGNGWWLCPQCGKIGYTWAVEHQPTQHPLTLFAHGVIAYLLKRSDKTTTAQMVNQTLYLVGTTLRQAADSPSLGDYVQK